jgi:hypothetical protein
MTTIFIAWKTNMQSHSQINFSWALSNHYCHDIMGSIDFVVTKQHESNELKKAWLWRPHGERTVQTKIARRHTHTKFTKKWAQTQLAWKKCEKKVWTKNFNKKITCENKEVQTQMKCPMSKCIEETKAFHKQTCKKTCKHNLHKRNTKLLKTCKQNLKKTHTQTQHA